MTTARMKNTTAHGTAIPNVRGGAEGTQLPSKEPVVASVEQTPDKNQIEPISEPKPINFKGEKQLATYLAKVYGETPVYGADLSAVFDVATDDYYTEAEQRACIDAAVSRLLPDPAPEPQTGLRAEWERRCVRQNTIRVPKTFKNGASGLSDINPDSRPDWSSSYWDYIGDNASDCLYRSEPLVASTLLSHHGAVDAKGALMPAYLQLHVFQDATGARPQIRFDRYEAPEPGANVARVLGSDFVVSLSEAAQLAHSILAAIDLASEVTE